MVAHPASYTSCSERVSTTGERLLQGQKGRLLSESVGSSRLHLPNSRARFLLRAEVRSFLIPVAIQVRHADVEAFPNLVYHYASVTPGRRWGRSLGFFTGYLNFYAYVFGVSSFGYIFGQVTIQMWALFHPDFIIQDWHIFLSAALFNVFCCLMVVFGNSLQPTVQRLGSAVVIVGGLATIIVLAASSKKHASDAFAWTDWVNVTGWSSGTAFMIGEIFGSFFFFADCEPGTDLRYDTGMLNGYVE